MPILDSLDKVDRPVDAPFRFVVSDIFKPVGSSVPVVAGRVVSGAVSAGVNLQTSKIVCLPSGQAGTVRSIRSLAGTTSDGECSFIEKKRPCGTSCQTPGKEEECYALIDTCGGCVPCLDKIARILGGPFLMTDALPQSNAWPVVRPCRASREFSSCRLTAPLCSFTRVDQLGPRKY